MITNFGIFFSSVFTDVPHAECFDTSEHTCRHIKRESIAMTDLSSFIPSQNCSRLSWQIKRSVVDKVSYFVQVKIDLDNLFSSKKTSTFRTFSDCHLIDSILNSPFSQIPGKMFFCRLITIKWQSFESTLNTHLICKMRIKILHLVARTFQDRSKCLKLINQVVFQDSPTSCLSITILK